MAANEFDAFCRDAFGFLDASGTRYLVVDGLAVMVVGEPRTTADADAVVFVSAAEAEALIRRAAGAGFDVREETERERLATTGSSPAVTPGSWTSRTGSSSRTSAAATARSASATRSGS